MPEKNITVHPKGCLRGTMIPPGDKSISHRCIMLGSLATGTTVVKNFLSAEDCRATITAFQKLGVSIVHKDTDVTIHGVGMGGLQNPSQELFLGNSGTTMRLLAGILAGQPFNTMLSGDASLQSRPMDRIVEPLRMMGAAITGNGKHHTAPLKIEGRQLKAIHYDEERGSAQVKSCILLAGMFASGKTMVREVRPSRDHTERMLQQFKAPFTKEGKVLIIKKTEMLEAQKITIPGDISSAAFLIVAALLLKKSDLIVENVGLNPSRMGAIHILQKMGARIDIVQKNDTPEPCGTLHVANSKLKGIHITTQDIPYLIDELPVCMVAATCADGETVISGANELRLKETDRINSMVTGLQKLGADIRDTEDGVIIKGMAKLKGGATVDSLNDHRTAMSLAVAGIAAEQPIHITDPQCVAISYPDFFTTLDRLTE